MASIVRPTAGRAVHLRITPRPSNLGESREILRLISQFGEVEYFKNLKYDALTAPNTALVIFKEEQAAFHVLKRSPIRFRMGKAPASEQETPPPESHPRPVADTSPPTPGAAVSSTPPQTPPAGRGSTTQTRSISTKAALPKPAHPPLQTPFQPPPPRLPDSRIFQIQTNSARVHFRDQIDMGYYHGRFAIDGKSISQKDLEQTVPFVGLSAIDWRAQGRPWRVIEKDKVRERVGPERRRGLREIYEEGAVGKGKAVVGGQVWRG